MALLTSEIGFSKGSIEYQNMRSTWIEINDVYQGSFAITNSKNIESYLIRFTSETDNSYDTRKKFSRFENFFLPTIRQISNLPFSENIEIPQKFQENGMLRNFMRNVDGKGVNAEAFFKKVFNYSLSFGFCGVLVDYPNFDSQENSQKEDTEKYPNFTLFKPLDIKGVWGSYINGVFQIERVWLSAVNTQFMNNVQESKTIYFYEYALTESGKVSVNKYDQEDKKIGQETIIDIDHIPFHLFYISDDIDGITECVPYFYDLMKMNLSHFNKVSDYDHIVKVTSFPMLYAIGLGTPDEVNNIINVSPQKILASQNKDAKFGYVEHSGRSIESSRKAIIDLEIKMKMYEIQFLLKRGPSVTATEIVSEESKSSSLVKLLASEMDDFIKSCMKDALYFKGIKIDEDKEDEELNFQTFKKFSILSMVRDKVKIILDTYKAGTLSKKTVLDELKRYDILNRDIDTEEELLQIEKEAQSELSSMLNEGEDDNDNQNDEENNNDENNNENNEGENNEESNNSEEQE